MPPNIGRAFVGLVVSIAAVRLLVASEYWSRALFQLSIPVEDSFFPSALRDPLLLLTAVYGPLVAEVMVVWRPTATRMRATAVVEIVSAAVLMVHQASFYKATWIVVFWCGWLLAWLASSAVRHPDLIPTCGPLLAQAIVAFFFLGGAVGKWTAGYWSGDVFHDILFQRHTGILHQHLRSTLDEAALWRIATIYSRSIVIIETAMVGIVLVPPRVASVLIALAALGLWASSSNLFEIALPLVGLAAVVWHLSTGPTSGTIGGLHRRRATGMAAELSPSNPSRGEGQ
jgi:hypothetical protein